MYPGGMEWLNYHHLLYFWVVAKEGTIAAACKEWNLAQPTIPAQLRVLEESLGAKLVHTCWAQPRSYRDRAGGVQVR